MKHGQRDEAALAEGAGDAPRLDAAADIDLQGDHQHGQERDAARVTAPPQREEDDARDAEQRERCPGKEPVRR